MGIAQKAQENPVIAMISMLAAVAVAATAIWNGLNLVDAVVLTEAEGAVIHSRITVRIDTVNEQVTHESKLNECRYLSDKIDRLEYEIYVLQRDQASPDFIQSKASLLQRERRKFTALLCAGLV